MPANATELVSLNDDLGISRDFANIVLTRPELQSARVFVDINRLVVKGLSEAENGELRRVATDFLGAKAQLVAKKTDANYLVQIRMERYTDYAIRNPKHVPARGFVMSSICKFPIGKVENDCENLTYFYFRKYRPIEIFRSIFSKWVDTVMPVPSDH